MRKEYNDRWNAPLVNPGFTIDEYNKQKEADGKKESKLAESKPKSVFQPTIDGVSVSI